MNDEIDWTIKGINSGGEYFAECRKITGDLTGPQFDAGESGPEIRRVEGYFTVKDDAEFLEMKDRAIQLRAHIPLIGNAVVTKVEAVDSRHHKISFRSTGEVKRISP